MGPGCYKLSNCICQCRLWMNMKDRVGIFSISHPSIHQDYSHKKCKQDECRSGIELALVKYLKTTVSSTQPPKWTGIYLDICSGYVSNDVVLTVHHSKRGYTLIIHQFNCFNEFLVTTTVNTASYATAIDKTSLLYRDDNEL